MGQTKKRLMNYYTKSEDDAYGHLRDIVRRHGGRMWHEKKGYRYGAWKIRLNGKTVPSFEGTGMGNLPTWTNTTCPRDATREYGKTTKPS